MSYTKKYILQEVLAYLVSVGVPIATTLIVFPDSVSVSAHLSMSFILTIIISLTAFRKKLSALFANSPVVVAWVIILAISAVLKTFADEMLIISISGVASSTGATPLFNMAAKNKEKGNLLKETLMKNEIESKAEAPKGDEPV